MPAMAAQHFKVLMAPLLRTGSSSLCLACCYVLPGVSSSLIALFSCRSEDSGVSALVADDDLSGVVADLPEDSLDVSIDDLMGSMAVSPPTEGLWGRLEMAR